jgi:hypothetical protein
MKAVRALMVALEATILASVHKKGLGSFTLPGLLKVNVINVPAKKKRRGIDPLHQGGAGVRGQAGDGEDQDPRPEKAQGRGSLAALRGSAGMNGCCFRDAAGALLTGADVAVLRETPTSAGCSTLAIRLHKTERD